VASEEVRIAQDAVTSNWTYEPATGFVTSASGSGFTTVFERSAEGNVSAQVDGRGNRTTLVYDWGTVREIRTPLTIRTFDLNPDGTIASESSGGLQTTYGYDPEGRPTYVKGPGTSSPVEYDYGDAFGRRLERVIHRAAAPGQADSPTELHMDAFGRPRRTYFVNAGLWTEIDRDASGRVWFQSAPFSDTSVSAARSRPTTDSIA
jgi:hypothetical protein